MAETIGTLAVVLTAVDKSAAGINAFRDRLGTAVEPTRQLSAAFGRLGEAAGLGRLSAGLTMATGHASTLARTVTTAAFPLAAGGLVAGAAAMATNFVNIGKDLLEGSRSLGMSVSDLHAFRNGAQLAGLGAAEAQAGLESFDKTLTDAFYGRNPAAVAASQMERLGFSIRDSAGRARSGADALGDLAEAYARLNHDPNAQAEFARIWNVQGLDRYLRRGREGVAELTRQGRARGVLTEEEAKQAKRLGDQWNDLRLIADTTATSIGGAMAPALEDALTRTTRWTLANREWLATNISTRVEQVGRGTWTFVSAVDKAIQSTIGWEHATTALEVLLAAKLLRTLTGINAAGLALSALTMPAWALRLLGLGGALGFVGAAGGEDREFSERKNEEFLRDRAGVGQDGVRRSAAPGLWERSFNFPNERLPGGREPLTGLPSRFNREAEHRYGERPDAVTRRHQDAFSYFRSRGWSEVASAGIVANLHHESGVRHDGPAGDGGMSKGLAQWNRGRLDAFREFAGVDIGRSTRAQQLAFVHHELTAGRDAQARLAGDVLRTAQTARAAGEAFSRLYERPAGGQGEAASRGNTAENFLPRLNGRSAARPPEGLGGYGADGRDELAEEYRARARQVPPPAAPERQSPLSALQPSGGGRLAVDVRFGNAPRDVNVSSRAEGAFDVGEMRIERAMQGWDAA